MLIAHAYRKRCDVAECLNPTELCRVVAKKVGEWALQDVGSVCLCKQHKDQMGQRMDKVLKTGQYGKENQLQEGSDVKASKNQEK